MIRASQGIPFVRDPVLDVIGPPRTTPVASLSVSPPTALWLLIRRWPEIFFILSIALLCLVDFVDRSTFGGLATSVLTPETLLSKLLLATLVLLCLSSCLTLRKSFLAFHNPSSNPSWKQTFGLTHHQGLHFCRLCRFAMWYPRRHFCNFRVRSNMMPIITNPYFKDLKPQRGLAPISLVSNARFTGMVPSSIITD